GVPDLPMPVPPDWLPRCPNSASALALTFRCPVPGLLQAGAGPAFAPPHPGSTGVADAWPAETPATTSTIPSSIAAYQPAFRLPFTASHFLPHRDIPPA